MVPSKKEAIALTNKDIHIFFQPAVLVHLQNKNYLKNYNLLKHTFTHFEKKHHDFRHIIQLNIQHYNEYMESQPKWIRIKYPLISS